jgi:branched-chain amino acid transport system ATP-binding protein
LLLGVGNPFAVLLRTRDLTKCFGGFTALDRVSLDLPEDETRAIIGPNGAGKTTLFNLLMGVYPPTKGTIKFDGEDITDGAVYERPYAGISRSYQVTNLYQELTVFENLQTAVGVFHGNYYDMLRPLDGDEEVTRSAESLLGKLGLKADRDVEAAALSHGDKRRLEIGMALAAEPRLLLLDEPTAGMGASEAEETIKLVRELGKEMTVILVEHNIEAVMRVSQTITVLERGRVIAEGGPDAIREDERVQEAYLGRDVRA